MQDKEFRKEKKFQFSEKNLFLHLIARSIVRSIVKIIMNQVHQYVHRCVIYISCCQQYLIGVSQGESSNAQEAIGLYFPAAPW